MSTSLYKLQAANTRRTFFLFTVFSLVVIGLGYVFAELYGNVAILYGFVATSVIMQIVAYWRSDKVVIRMNGAKRVSREEYPDLWNTVENLAITDGLPMPAVYVIHDRVPNALATGRSPKHAAVAVTTGLLSIMNKVELEGVIAHELSHIKNRDTLVQTVAVVLAGFLSIAAHYALRFSFITGGNRNREQGGVFIIFGLLLMILAPLAASLLQLAISRKREYLADASGALLTRYPEGLASALEKLKAHSGEMRLANDATAHLFIANPFGAKARQGFHALFMTHPPLDERISILRQSETVAEK